MKRRSGGKLRTGTVGISGTDYVPPVPEYETVKRELEQIILSDTTATEKALEVFAWGPVGSFSGTATSEPV